MQTVACPFCAKQVPIDSPHPCEARGGLAVQPCGDFQGPKEHLARCPACGVVHVHHCEPFNRGFWSLPHRQASRADNAARLPISPETLDRVRRGLVLDVPVVSIFGRGPAPEDSVRVELDRSDAPGAELKQLDRPLPITPAPLDRVRQRVALKLVASALLASGTTELRIPADTELQLVEVEVIHDGVSGETIVKLSPKHPNKEAP